MDVLLLAAVLAILPGEQVTVDEVDLVEVNHFYVDNGRLLVFNQIIYYDWSDTACRFQVRDWRLIKSPSQIPLRDWRDGGYASEWEDFNQRNGLRRVKAKSARETWTQHDPELVEREFLPQEKRKPLTAIHRSYRFMGTAR